MLALAAGALGCAFLPLASERFEPDPVPPTPTCATPVRQGEAVRCGGPGDALAPLEALWLGRKLDLNSIDAAALTVVPGIGERLAARIVADREAHGPFRDWADVGSVRGVGPRLLAVLARWAEVRAPCLPPQPLSRDQRSRSSGGSSSRKREGRRRSRSSRPAGRLTGWVR